MSQLKNKNKELKEPVSYPAKKLPKIFKKKYTEKQFNKKILKKIYIQADKDFISGCFKEIEKNKKGIVLLGISSEKQFDKDSFNKLKKLGKEIKKQKGRVKWVPLLAILIFLAAIVVFSMFFKNKVIKSVIINTVQNSTEARCDIDSINVDLFNATFTMKGFAVADKNNPMKNTVSIGNVNFDFNMLELLKSKFIANDLSITEFELNSERKTSGKLSDSELKKIHDKKAKKAEAEAKKLEKQKKKEQKPKKESKLISELKGKANNSVNVIQDSISQIASPYNPETLYANMTASLQTPEIAANVEKEVREAVEKYSALPAELEKNVNKGIEVVNSISSISIDELKKDPLKIADTVELLKKNYDEVMLLKEETEKQVNDIQKDYKKYSAMTENIQKSIDKDSKYIKSEVNKITSIKLDDGVEFISESFSTILCNLLGDYYPYYEKAMAYLEQMNANKKEKTPKKTATKSRRSSGRTIYYKNDSNPNFWIKRIAGSGGNISFKIQNITNDMDKTTKPVTGNFNALLAGISHNADFTVDNRKGTSAPLVYVKYDNDDVPVKFPASNFGNVPGLPGIDSSKGKFDISLDVYDEENFKLSGIADLTQLKLSAKSFEPAFVSDIYKNVLDGISAMNADFNIENSSSKGLNIGFNSDIDKVFASSLKKEMDKELSKIKKDAEQMVVEKLNEVSNGALGEIQNFEDLMNKINEEKAKIDNLPKEIEKKINEAQNFAKNAVDESLNKAKQEAEKKKAELEKQAQEELEKKKKEAEAEAERLRKEAEAAAKKKAEEEAKKLLKKLF